MIYRKPINSGFELPVRFTYREPHWLPVYYVMLHLGAFLSILVAGLPVSARVILILYVISSFIIWIHSRQFKKSHNSGLEIKLDIQNVWTLREVGLKPEIVKLVSARILCESLVFIKLKSTSGKNYDLWLSRACADENNLRRLRVRLLLPIATVPEK